MNNGRQPTCLDIRLFLILWLPVQAPTQQGGQKSQ